MVDAARASGNNRIEFKQFEAAAPAGNPLMTGHDVSTPALKRSDRSMFMHRSRVERGRSVTIVLTPS